LTTPLHNVEIDTNLLPDSGAALFSTSQDLKYEPGLGTSPLRRRYGLSMYSRFPARLTTGPSYRQEAACLTRNTLYRFSMVRVAVPGTSLPLGGLHATWSRPKATIFFLSRKAHDLLPLPALSSSRSHLCSNLSLAVLEELRHSSALTFHSGRAWISGISDCRAFWLVSYFVLNLVLTLYNKVLLGSFPYPYTLTATHALFGLVGGTCLRLRAVYQPKSLWGSDYVLLVAFSFLYSINIAVSNASLDIVTVPVSQLPRFETTYQFTFTSSIRLSAPQHHSSLLSSHGTCTIPVTIVIKFLRLPSLSLGSV
jgi:hypothetical protein